MSPRTGLREFGNRIDALSLRERAMIMIGAFMVLFLLWDWLLMSDIERDRRAISTEMEANQERIRQLNEAIATASQARSRDPNVLLEEKLAEAKHRAESLDKIIAQQSAQVVSPADMSRVLEQILQRQGRLKLVRAESLPPVPVFEDAGGESGGAVYRHGLEFIVQGRYLDVLAYLKELEALDWKFFWDAVELESEGYPDNRIRIRIYTLNLEEGWLGV